MQLGIIRSTTVVLIICIFFGRFQYRFAETVKIMVTLSILFSYGLQFCVPSEIVWTRLEPWLRKRRLETNYPNPTTDTETSNIAVSAIAGDIVTTTKVTSSMSHITNDEKKQTENKLDEQERFMDWEYYVMRALMILGTCTVPYYIDNSVLFNTHIY